MTVNLSISYGYGSQQIGSVNSISGSLIDSGTSTSPLSEQNLPVTMALIGDFCQVLGQALGINPQALYQTALQIIQQYVSPAAMANACKVTPAIATGVFGYSDIANISAFTGISVPSLESGISNLNADLQNILSTSSTGQQSYYSSTQPLSYGTSQSSSASDLTNLSLMGTDTSATSGGDSNNVFYLLARVLGNYMDNKLGDMSNNAQQLQGLSSTSSNFGSLTAKIQADSQMINIISGCMTSVFGTGRYFAELAKGG